MSARKPDIAVVIPCFRVREKIAEVVSAIPPQIKRIYCVDDACPDGSGEAIRALSDPRVRLLSHEVNKGVGGAVVTGYRAALEDRADIVVKIDGDGQMDPALISAFVRPILAGEADYTKGNRFYRIEDVRGMPPVRIFGNAVLSFMTKLSSGYWHLFDSTNGYTAIHASVLRALPLEKLSERYFFESDILFRLNTVHACVRDIPMQAVYADERSNLRIGNILLPFFTGHMRNFHKRIVYNYFLRNFSIASLELVLGTLLLTFGLVFGLASWNVSLAEGVPATPGTVMLSALPVLIGVQLLLSFLQYDISATPTRAIHPSIDMDETTRDSPPGN
ncbi:MAG: glycosyltransferase family 2 protein [Alphaproteobacteria bacterium]|nr:glycosyltransferase family 2 protein [Alphaproteobacteria bacterium]